jgi:hypothetical protein
MRYFTILAALTAILFAGPAFASKDKSSCKGNCGGGSTSEAAASSTAFAGAAAGAGVFGSGNSSATAGSAQVDSSSNVVFEDAENSASSPSTLILGTCQAGLTANTQMGGGSMGGPDEVCLLFTLAQMYYEQGDTEAGDRTLKRVDDTLRWRNNVVRRFFQAIPLIGRIF